MLGTLQKLFGHSELEMHGQDAYNGCVAQARNPVFYEQFGVPDTLEGRFELIVLHVWLHLTRTKETESPEQQRSIVEAFFKDMDQNLREFGIDMGIKKRMRAMADGYNGRITAYDTARDANDDTALKDAFARNIFGECDQPPSDGALTRLLAYAQAALAQPARASDWPALSLDTAGK